MKQLVKRNLGVLVMFIALFVSSSVFAQPPGGGQQGPPSVPNAKQIQKKVAKVSKKLSLSDKQEIQVSKLYTAHYEEVKSKLKSGRPEQKEMEALENKFEKEVNKVLTTEQQKLFAAYQKKNRQQQMGGQPPIGGQRPNRY